MNKKPVIITSFAALAAVALIGGLKYRSIQKQIAEHAAMVMPPATVSTAKALEEAWTKGLQSVGTMTSFQGVTVRTELEGLVIEVFAQSGTQVSKDALLVRLDTSAEEAQLEGLRAQARLTALNLERARELRTTKTNTPSDLDAAEAASSQAQAAVRALEVSIAKKQIRAPFSGRLGIVKVYPGQFLNKGDALVALEATDQIHVDFSMSQQTLRELSLKQAVTLTIDAFPGRVFEASITAISPRVEEATRMIDVRATLPNPEGLLRPGMYAKAQISLPSEGRAIVVPATAITYNPYGETVFVVENGVARQHFIKTGAARGDLIQILEGLKPGVEVITSGQIKLRNGSPVKVDNSVRPQANATPTPVES